jgi:hypothetical protein
MKAVLGMLVLGMALVSCSEDEDSGGTAGTSTGGSGGTSTGGSSGTSTGGSSGTSTGGSSGTSTGGSSGTSAGGSSTGGSAGSSGSGGTGGTAGTAGTGGTGGSSGIPGGGTILFEEKFDDADFESRGWYDDPKGTISTTEKAPGSSASYECAFAQGATTCTSGKPARRKFTASPTAYASFWLKFSNNWVGSGKAYHPHMFHFINDRDDDWVGPSHTYLTTYVEVVGGRAMLALQDSKNVDTDCILHNDDSFVGCNGDFSTYVFGEERSVAACNGLAGYVDGRDCFSIGGGDWYSSRAWYADDAFTEMPGANYKGDWHFVEVYFEMNTIQGGAGVADGKIRWVQDGNVLIASDEILFRTGDNANLQFNQFDVFPYIGDGSPVAQQFWVDDLTVATAKP